MCATAYVAIHAHTGIMVSAKSANFLYMCIMFTGVIVCLRQNT